MNERRSTNRIRQTVARAGMILLALVIGGLGSSCRRDAETVDEEIAYEIEETSTRGPLEVIVRAEKQEISLADVNRIEVEARIDPGYEVRFGDLLEGFTKVIVRDFYELPSTVDVEGKKVYRRRYRVEANYSGEASIEPFEVHFSKAAIVVADGEPGGASPGDETIGLENDGPDDKQYVCESKPIVFKVSSFEESGQEIPDIRGLKEPVVLPKPPVSKAWVFGVAGGIVGLIALCLIWRWRRRRPHVVKKVQIPPHEIAYAELVRLREDDLIGQGLFEEFYVRLSGILRRYIEGRFALRAPERTTEEFLIELSRYRADRALSDAHRRSLAEFLNHTDLVKFAALTPTTEQIQESFDLAKTFIEETKGTRRMEAA